ncbi:restriction endonuclease subunit S [Kocuria sp.]|uniref:restriction endonuclease subunit S n=1 Tax=Kocuria sp. TaxID=1871328 RepID=UPI0028AD3904|nr:restriction endonuclease subunit S [Kocuria sp.]
MREIVSSKAKWIGDVPSSWNILQPRRLFTLRRELEHKDDIQLTPSQKYGVLPQTEYMEVTGSRVVLNLTGNTMQHVEPGDFISHLRTFQGGLELARQAGKVSPAYTVVTPRPGVNPEFFKYVLKSDGYISQIASVTDQLRDGQSMRFPEFNQTWLPLPPTLEQQQIADYLDHETAEIDAFVEDQHKILHLVSERRWSAIDRAIEQGTERVPLRRLAKYLTSGSRNWSSLLSESGDPFVRITNISRNHVRILSEDMEFVAGVEDAEGARAKIQMGDILMSITADLGSVALADESIEGGYTSQHVCLIRPNNHLADPKYVAYALLSSKVKAQIAEKSYGGTKIQLSLEDVRELEIPLPPLQEQRRVAQQCEDFVTTTEGLSSELQRIIALSRERRAALITAAVTGQIDVTAKNKPAAEQLEDDVAQGLHREYA